MKVKTKAKAEEKAKGKAKWSIVRIKLGKVQHSKSKVEYSRVK